MENEPDTFVQLQKHLDAQAVGFPATKKKSEIRLLQLIFKPDQAKIALNLSYHYEPVGAILSRMQASSKITMTREELEQILDQMGKDRAIMRRIRNGEKQYAIVPFVVGMFELQLGLLNKEFVTTMNEYIANTNFALSFIGTEYSQMRTIPIEQSITPEHHITNYNDLNALIMRSPGPFVINKCICREKQSVLGNSCKVTKRTEVCLSMGDMGQACADVGLGRVISKDEALEIERLNEEDGLVLQPSGAQEIQFICACCGCCCGMLHVQHQLSRPTDFWTTDYYSVVDLTQCKGCGLCSKRCQVNAIKMIDSVSDPKKKIASIDVTRCIGCGLCVVKCANHAISLKRKDNPLNVPKTDDELYDEIKQKRKSKWQLLKMGIKMKRGKKWH